MINFVEVCQVSLGAGGERGLAGRQRGCAGRGEGSCQPGWCPLRLIVFELFLLDCGCWIFAFDSEFELVVVV